MGGYNNVGGAWETCTGAINFVCLISFLDFSVAMLSAKMCDHNKLFTVYLEPGSG